MDVTTLSIDKETAMREYEEYERVIKERKGETPKFLRQMKKMYSHLKDGKKVLDIYRVFKETGTKEGLPKLAICRADKTRVIFRGSSQNGRGSFNYQGRRKNAFWNTEYLIQSLPKGTFPKLKKDFKQGDRYEAVVPIIPARFMPKDSLKNYYMLWEVDKWEKQPERPAGKDPFLLKKISKNLYIILAYWDLTPLEQSLIRR